MQFQNQFPVPTNRILFLNGLVNEDSMARIMTDIIIINEDDKKLKQLYPRMGIQYSPDPIKLYINTFGGALYDAFGLVSVMETSLTPIHTLVTGKAMSAGFLILISGHKRFALKHSELMYHQLSTATNGKLGDVETTIEQSKKQQKKMEKVVLSKTKLTHKMLEKIYAQKTDYYMTSKEAIKYGVIDKILETF
jgi:ATP-dependent Clp protease, protease subunit